MPVKSGVILSKSEILTEHGIIEKHTTEIPKGTKVWIYYNNRGQITLVEKKEIFVPIKPRNKDRDGE